MIPLIQQDEDITFDLAVKKVKRLALVMKDIKWETAKLATQVCTIQKGGHGKGKKIYSLKKFADDTGINWGTLKSWTNDYFLAVNKFTPDQLSRIKPKALSRALKKITRNTMPDDALRIYEAEARKTEEDERLEDVAKRMRTIAGFLCNELQIKKVDQEVLEKIYIDVLDIQHVLTEHFTTKKKYKTRLVSDSEVKMLKLNKFDF